jgi:hypothetical protein
LWHQLTQLTHADQQVNLDTLLQVPEGEHTTLVSGDVKLLPSGQVEIVG